MTIDDHLKLNKCRWKQEDRDNEEISS